MYDLIDILEKEMPPKDIVMLLKQYISSFYIEFLHEYAIEHNVCPECCSDLVLRTWRENRGESLGYTYYEEMGAMWCEYCGKYY